MQRTTRNVMYSLSYRQTSEVSRTLVGNKVVAHSDVVGGSPVGAATLNISFKKLANYPITKKTHLTPDLSQIVGSTYRICYYVIRVIFNGNEIGTLQGSW